MKFSRPVRLLAFAVLIGAISFTGVSLFFAWQFTGPMRRPLATAPEKFLSTYETVRFTARDGIPLAGWFVPCAGAKQAVVLLHGHGSTRTQMLARAKFFRDQGFAVLLYDARGHGESGGERVSFGWFETSDLLGAIAWLRTRGFAEFGCVGASQGGATIALAATELLDVRWVILESVYPTLADAVDRRFRHAFGLPGWMAGALMIPLAEWRLGINAHSISPRDAVAKLRCPVFVISGDRDAHTLPADTQNIFQHALEPKSLWLVPGATHVDLYGFAKRDYEVKVLEFLARLPAKAASAR